jgi:transcriptional regulator with XRE-family HTH domain
MKQPELGKKIAEIRLANGLTQVELAEKCNLSLRTIQRIESAEVTPRSYTIKLIFENLNETYGQSAPSQFRF